MLDDLIMARTESLTARQRWVLIGVLRAPRRGERDD